MPANCLMPYPRCHYRRQVPAEDGRTELPGESLTDYLKSRAATMRRKKNKAQDLRFRLLLSDIYSDVVEKSDRTKCTWTGSIDGD